MERERSQLVSRTLAAIRQMFKEGEVVRIEEGISCESWYGGRSWPLDALVIVAGPGPRAIPVKLVSDYRQAAYAALSFSSSGSFSEAIIAVPRERMKSLHGRRLRLPAWLQSDEEGRAEAMTKTVRVTIVPV